MKRTTLLAAALVLSAGAGWAAVTNDQLISDLQAQGYTRIEIRNGPTQVKVEAIRGTEKLEVVYDRETGSILDRDTDRVEGDDTTSPGVSVRDRSRDFVSIGDDDGDHAGDDDTDDDSRDDDHDSDDNTDDNRSDDDNGSDHDGGGNGGGDDGDDNGDDD